MLTTQSIFEELQSENESFRTYKELLDSVRKVWQKNVGVLPVEIGPRDILELAVLRQWIRQNENGTIRIVVPKETGRPARPRAGSKRSPALTGLALGNGRTGAARGTSRAVTWSAAAQ